MTAPKVSPSMLAGLLNGPRREAFDRLKAALNHAQGQQKAFNRRRGDRPEPDLIRWRSASRRRPRFASASSIAPPTSAAERQGPRHRRHEPYRGWFKQHWRNDDGFHDIDIHCVLAQLSRRAILVAAGKRSVIMVERLSENRMRTRRYGGSSALVRSA
ncbi:MAG: hypothetical protein ACXIVG_09305 [Pararhodobacter sp.]